MPKENLQAETDRATEAERTRVSEITSLCRGHQCDAMLTDFIKDGTTVDDVAHASNR